MLPNGRLSTPTAIRECFPFSPNSFSKRFDAELIVLRVIDPRYRELEMAISPRPGRFKQIEKKVMEDAQKILDTVRLEATVNYDYDSH